MLMFNDKDIALIKSNLVYYYEYIFIPDSDINKIASHLHFIHI